MVVPVLSTLNLSILLLSLTRSNAKLEAAPIILRWIHSRPTRPIVNKMPRGISLIRRELINQYMVKERVNNPFQEDVMDLSQATKFHGKENLVP